MSENVLILLATIPGFCLGFTVRGTVDMRAEFKRLREEAREIRERSHQ